MNEEIKNEIQKLKKEKDAVILAHYYVDGEVQEIADYVGGRTGFQQPVEGQW